MMNNILVPQSKPVVWQGDSLKVVRNFSKSAKIDIGIALRNLQRSKTAKDVKRVKGSGPGVFELRTQDARTWYRVLYIAARGRIFVLHAFEKQSNRIPKNEIEIASVRLSEVREQLAAEKKNEKNE
jgi:phage-related protein